MLWYHHYHGTLVRGGEERHVSTLLFAHDPFRPAVVESNLQTRFSRGLSFHHFQFGQHWFREYVLRTLKTRRVDHKGLPKSRLLEEVIRGHLRGEFPGLRSRNATAVTLSACITSIVAFPQPDEPAVGSQLCLSGRGRRFPPFRVRGRRGDREARGNGV